MARELGVCFVRLDMTDQRTADTAVAAVWSTVAAHFIAIPPARKR